MNNSGFNSSKGLEDSQLNVTISEVDEVEEREAFQEKENELSEALVGQFDDLDFGNRDVSFVSDGNVPEDQAPHVVSNKDETYSKGFDVPEKLLNGHSNGLTNGTESLSSHYKHCFAHPNLESISEQLERTTSSGNGDQHENMYPGGDAQQLADMYGIRMREMKRLADKCSSIEEELKEQCSKLKKQIYQLEADKAALQTSNTQSQALLVDSKEENESLKREVGTLKQSNNSLETVVDNLSHELRVSNLTIENLQSKVQVLERGSVKKLEDEQVDNILKSTQERHRREVNNLQNRIEELQMKINTTESSLREAERKILEKTRQYENTLSERGEIVNRLQKALDESQRRCQELMINQQPGQQVQQLQQQVAKLEYALDLAHGDIDQLETLLGLQIFNKEDDSEWPNSNKIRATLTTEDGLREKLANSLRLQEVRRGENKRLTEELKLREQELMDLKGQEMKYRQVVNNLKVEYEKVLKQIQGKRNSRATSTSSQGQEESNLIQQLNDEVSKLKEQITATENEKHDLETCIEHLEKVKADLVEQTIEIQRNAEETTMKTIDNHNSEYLKFHQRAVIAAKQAERKQAEDAINKIRAELEIERKEVEKLKNEYVAVCDSKSAIIAELEQLRNQLKSRGHTDLPTHDSPDIEEKLRQRFDHKVIVETQKAKEAMLREFDVERRNLLKEVTKEMTEKLEIEKREWKKNQPLTQLVGDEALKSEISRLNAALAEQSAALHKERQDAWSGYQKEIMNVAEHRKQLGLPPLSCQDRATSPIPSVDSTHHVKESPSKYDQQMEQLEDQLEQTKIKHVEKLQQLQTHLQAKHQEMENFKMKVMEFTKHQQETQEQESMQYINVLKNQISTLTTELSETKKSTDSEREKLNGIIEKWSNELKILKNEKQLDAQKIFKMQTKLRSFDEKFAQLKDYYEKREKFLLKDFKSREEKYYETLLKLKNVTDSLSQLQFPHFDKPDKDV